MSAERCRYPYLENKCVVVVKGSDKRIFNQIKQEGVLFDGVGAFNSVLEFKNKIADNYLEAWKDEFIDKESGIIYGTVIAKSYEAKEYGIKTGTLLRDALKMCSHLIVIPSDHLYYQELSNRLRIYLQSKIPLLEQYSVDEFFGDLNGWVDDEETEEYISAIQTEILQKFNLPITIAASKSKWVAKLAVGRIKPYGVKVLRNEEIDAFVNPIHISEFPGVGRAIQKKLESYFITTLGEAKERPQLFSAYGKMGSDLYKRICGTDNEAVLPYSQRKGMGIGRSFKPVRSRQEIYCRVTILVKYLSYTLMKLKLNPITFHFKIRYEYNLKESKSITINRLFHEKVLNEFALAIIKELDTHPGYKINYIGISSSNFVDRYNRKVYSVLEYEYDTKMRALALGLTKIRDKYGINAIYYGVEGLLAS